MPVDKPGCEYCSEIDAEFESGYISTTVVDFGSKCRIAFECHLCGRVKEITTEVKQISFPDFMELIKTKNSEE